MIELIECDGCGRSLTTEDPDGMLAAITGPCPTCGGSFHLAAIAAAALQARRGESEPPPSR